MTRYRDAEAAAKPAIDTGAPIKIDYGTGKKKTINYIWMPDKDGNLIKKDSAFVKRTFSKLSEKAQAALAQYIITVQNRQPTDAARKTVFNDLISAAEDSFKQGKKDTIWDILQVRIDNAPRQTGPTVTYTSYDKITSDAVLQKAAKDLGFTQGSFAQFGEQDLADFFEKIKEAAKAGAKATQTIVRPDGTTEIIQTPGAFDANAFAQSYLWAKVNIGDTKTLPSSVIDKISGLKTLVKANGLGYFADKEIANYALQLAKGETSLEKLQAQFNAKAAELYPLFGERLKANPTLTVMDLAQPYIGRMVKYWEVDPSTIDLDNPDLDKFLRPDGTAGKVPMGTVADFETYLKFHPNSEKASWKIQGARDLATGLASAMGFGV